ncbi:sigma-70 family RNA polymerase sigma factor [Geomonas sp. RF6]|uniref:RNA polymerase sigma factor n=1 Tax=Geomonas sp. RF6 TaxID=2897342 RepID=UPI001E580328|nr:sigma-70 family RNA polymerase sigma factor [Geomonas sp. RF6]UFS70620.1 sigma-70 family RNA polymerase sigma factor [Geomonas sp. RF6]
MHDYDALYKEFQPRIHRYLCHLCGEADAPDLTQAVFLKASQALANFRGECSIATWIYRIATNTAHDHARSGSGAVREEEVELDAIPDAETPGAEKEYVRREMNACIRGVVDGLPEQYRNVLVMSDFEELSNLQIADILQISLDTVKIRLHRGRKKLKEALECQCTMYHDERNVLSCDRKPASGPAVVKFSIPTLIPSRRK